MKDQEAWKKGHIERSQSLRNLVGLIIPFKFQQLNKVNTFGIYRDDGLTVVQNVSGPKNMSGLKNLRRDCKSYLRRLV